MDISCDACSNVTNKEHYLLFVTTDELEYEIDAFIYYHMICINSEMFWPKYNYVIFVIFFVSAAH